MQRHEFVENLKKQGFEEVVTVNREANGFLDSHAHPFEALALILQGELCLEVDGVERVYPAGDVFHLPANKRHTERYGPQGVSYLVGRK